MAECTPQVAARARKAAGITNMPAAENGDERLVRIELLAAPAAEEELSFAGVLSAFLARATGSLKEVATRGEAAQVSVFSIAESLLASGQKFTILFTDI